MTVVLQSAFSTWDAIGHDVQAYAHGTTGLLVVRHEVAQPLLHNAGYREATRQDLQNAIDDLEGRAAQLRGHLERLT